MANVKDLLRKAADDYAPSLGELDSHVSDKAFAKGAFFSETTAVGDSPFKSVRDAAVDAGTMLLEDELAGVVLSMLKGGAGGMAPVILAAVVKGGVVTLGAYSKEGLIHQHAAKRAVESFETSLSTMK